MSIARYLSKLGTLLNSSGQVPAAGLATGAARANFGAGAVLQVVNATYSTTESNGTGTYADSGLTATITPTSPSSKILVLVSQNGVYGNTAAAGVNMRLMRNASAVCQFAVAQAYSTGVMLISVSTNYLDSPATTSPVTYKTQFARYTGSGNVTLQGNGDVSTITLIEVAA